MSFNWKVLQNGTDIRGISVKGVSGEEVNPDKERIEQLGKAFYQWLQKSFSGEINIAVGMDSRISGPELASAFSMDVVSQEGNVIDCGLASTPAMFMATMSANLNTQAGVMLTASHLPYNCNGLKFFTSEGVLNKSDIFEILEIAAENYLLDDGACLVAKILVKIARLHSQGENVSQLISELSHMLESVEYRLSIKDKDFASCGDNVIRQFTEMVAGIDMASRKGKL